MNEIDIHGSAMQAVIEILKQPEYGDAWLREVTAFVNGADEDEITDEQLELVDAAVIKKLNELAYDVNSSMNHA